MHFDTSCWRIKKMPSNIYETNTQPTRIYITRIKPIKTGLANLLAVSNESQELIGHGDKQLFQSEDEFLQVKVELHLTLPRGFSFLGVLA